MAESHGVNMSASVTRAQEKHLKTEGMAARILIVDDHEIVREGIRTLLCRVRPEWEVCGEAKNGKEAVEAAVALTPDILILDVTMPVMSGLEAASRIARLGLASRVLIFTMHETKSLIMEVRAAGAQGYVVKSQAARDLIVAIDRILAGGTFFGPEPDVQSQAQSQPTRN
ncbi:MAG: response regulator transcription factor [Candidatus Acidiferrales bacterium]